VSWRQVVGLLEKTYRRAHRMQARPSDYGYGERVAHVQRCLGIQKAFYEVSRHYYTLHGERLGTKQWVGGCRRPHMRAPNPTPRPVVPKLLFAAAKQLVMFLPISTLVWRCGVRAPFFAVPCDRFDAQHCNAKRTADGGVNHSHALELVFPEPDYANYGRAAALRKEVPPPKNDDGSFALAHFRSNLGTSPCRARNLFD
jgi:hypothetical protein